MNFNLLKILFFTHSLSLSMMREKYLDVLFSSSSFFSLSRSLVLIHQYTCLDVPHHRKTGTMITILFYINQGLEYQIREDKNRNTIHYIHVITMVNNTTFGGLVNENSVTGDSTGAIIYIIFVLLWYSSSILFLIAMRIGRSNESLDGQSILFDQNFRDQNANTEILSTVDLVFYKNSFLCFCLEELVDKQKRDKLWDIYLGTTGDMNDKITRDEIHRIRHIQKRLASLNEDPGGSLDDSCLLRSHSDLWSSVVDVSSSNSRLRTRRRSSLDQRILGEWKNLANELKTHENWPWAIQRLLIRRHLRRQRQTTECRSEP